MKKNSFLMKGAVALIAAVLVIGASATANAGPLTLRVGAYLSTTADAHKLANDGGPSLGLQYALPGVPSLFNGEGWTTNLTADFVYHGANMDKSFQYVPVSLDQVFLFEEDGALTPYAGFSLIAGTYKSDVMGQSQPWVTRFGAGLIFGAKLNTKMYAELRYDWLAKGNDQGTPSMLRGALGYAF